MATSEERASELLEICKSHGFQPSENQNLNQFVENHLTDLVLVRQVLADIVLGLTLGQGCIAVTRDGSGTVLISETAKVPNGVPYQLMINQSELGHTVVRAKIEKQNILNAGRLDELEKEAAKPNLIIAPGIKE